MATLPGIVRYNRWSDGQHDPRTPNHAATVLHQVHGLAGSVLEWGSDDPAILAYQLRERLPQFRGYLDQLEDWVEWVIQADPSEIPPVGAK